MIRKARVEDAVALLAIARAVHDTKDESKGFLLTRYEPNSFDAPIENGTVWVSVIDGEVAGFILVPPWTADEMATIRAYRIETSLEIDLAAYPAIHWIQAVAVSLEHRRIGVATRLYDALPPGAYLSAIAEHPLRNQASIDFHLNSGFRRVGTFERPEFHGMKNYRSGIYFRQKV